MKRTAWILIAMLLCLSVPALPAEAQTEVLPALAIPSLTDAVQAQSSWDVLQSVSAETKCRVGLKNGKTITGTLKEWTPERLVLSNSKGKLVDCLRPEVGRVETLSPGSRKKRVLTAGLVAFGIGSLVGYAAGTYIVDDSNAGSGTRVGVGAVMGGVWGGAAAGLAAIPKAERATLVYRAP